MYPVRTASTSITVASAHHLVTGSCHAPCGEQFIRYPITTASTSITGASAHHLATGSCHAPCEQSIRCPVRLASLINCSFQNSTLTAKTTTTKTNNARTGETKTHGTVLNQGLSFLCKQDRDTYICCDTNQQHST